MSPRSMKHTQREQLNKKKIGQRTTLLNLLELSKLGKDNLAKGRLGVVGNTDGADTVVDQDPLVLSSESLG